MHSVDKVKLDESKTRKMPLWVPALFLVIIIYQVVTSINRESGSLESFKEAFNQTQQIKFETYKNLVDTYSEVAISAGTLNQSFVSCILKGEKSWNRWPSIEGGAKEVFFKLWLKNEIVILEMRVSGGKTYFSPWIKQEFGFRGYGFRAVSPCESGVI